MHFQGWRLCFLLGGVNGWNKTYYCFLVRCDHGHRLAQKEMAFFNVFTKCYRRYRSRDEASMPHAFILPVIRVTRVGPKVSIPSLHPFGLKISTKGRRFKKQFYSSLTGNYLTITSVRNDVTPDSISSLLQGSPSPVLVCLFCARVTTERSGKCFRYVEALCNDELGP